MAAALGSITECHIAGAVYSTAIVPTTLAWHNVSKVSTAEILDLKVRTAKFTSSHIMALQIFGYLVVYIKKFALTLKKRKSIA